MFCSVLRYHILVSAYNKYYILLATMIMEEQGPSPTANMVIGAFIED